MGVIQVQMGVVNNHYILTLRYYAGLIIGCLHDVDKDQLLSSWYTPPGVPGDYWTTHPLVGSPNPLYKPVISMYRYQKWMQ